MLSSFRTKREPCPTTASERLSHSNRDAFSFTPEANVGDAIKNQSDAA